MRGSVTGNEAAAEAYQRLFQIVKQTGPGGRAGFLTRHHDIVDACDTKTRQKQAGGLAQAAPGAVADHRPTDLFGRGEAEAELGAGYVPKTSLHHHQTAALGITLCNIKEFTPDTQAFNQMCRYIGVAGD